MRRGSRLDRSRADSRGVGKTDRQVESSVAPLSILERHSTDEFPHRYGERKKGCAPAEEQPSIGAEHPSAGRESLPEDEVLTQPGLGIRPHPGDVRHRSGHREEEVAFGNRDVLEDVDLMYATQGIEARRDALPR